MKLANRIGAAVLATAMVGTLLTGCGGGSASTTASTGDGTAAASSTESSGMGTTPTPCLCVLPTWTGSRN